MGAPILQDWRLLWGDFEFVEEGQSESAFDVELLADGTHFGSPEAIVEQVRSLAMEGPLVRISGWEAREFPLRIRLGGNTGEQLAEGEAGLVAQTMMERPPSLAWTGPISLSAPNVFDVMIARLSDDTSEGWDLEEVLRGYRYFTLTMTCLTWVRSIQTTVIEALPAPTGEAAVTVEVDDGTDVTPAGPHAGTWTRETNGTGATGPTAVTFFGQTAIRTTAAIDSASKYLKLARSFDTPLAIPADNFLLVDTSITSLGGQPGGSWKLDDGTDVHDPVLVVAGGGEGNVGSRLYFADLPTPMSTFDIYYDFAEATGDTYSLHVFRVDVTDTLGGSDTTTRQQSRSAEVFGTVPTRATTRLYVAEDAEPLGEDILIYTTGNTNARLAMRPFLTDEGEAPLDVATAVSGKAHTLDTDAVYRIPSSLFAPGAHALMARVTTDTEFPGTLDLGWQVRMVDENGDPTIGSDLTTSGEVTLPDLGGPPNWAIVNLAERLTLPLIDVETDNYMVELTLTGSGAIAVDEVWPFSLDDGALTWVHGLDEITAIEVRSPELGAPKPSVWGGFSDRVVNLDRYCLSFGAHRFEPGPMLLFTVTSNALTSQCEMEYFPRFYSHVWAKVTE